MNKVYLGRLLGTASVLCIVISAFFAMPPCSMLIAAFLIRPLFLCGDLCVMAF
jgi:hypothetical protein